MHNHLSRFADFSREAETSTTNFSVYECPGSMETELQNGQLKFKILPAHGTQTLILKCLMSNGMALLKRMGIPERHESARFFCNAALWPEVNN